MCLCPITIPNPNYDSRFVKIEFKMKHHLRLTDVEKHLLNSNVHNLHNRSISQIQVPCGHCDECRLVRSNEFVQRCSMEAIGSHVFFFTLTYDNKHLPYIHCEFANDESGEINNVVAPYADFHDITNMFKRIRTYQERQGNGIPFRYVAVSERGTKKHRPHFHGLLFIPNSIDPYSAEDYFRRLFLKFWCINVGSRKNPIYEPLFTHVLKFYAGRPSTNFDFHYVRPNDVTGVTSPFYYVSKYITKGDAYIPFLKDSLKSFFDNDVLLYSNINKDIVNFDVVWRLVNPKIVCSRNFGLGALHNFKQINDYLKGCVKRSFELGCTFAKYYDVNTGKESNLCHYFKHINTSVIQKYNTLYDSDIQPFYDYEDAVMFYLNDKNNEYVDTLYISEETYLEYLNRVNRYKKRIKSISEPYHHLDDININLNFKQLKIF